MSPLVVFQPALPMRGVTALLALRAVGYRISTRTPHAGSDLARVLRRERILISTRTPHAGSDVARPAFLRFHVDFNPHSPCGE